MQPHWTCRCGRLLHDGTCIEIEFRASDPNATLPNERWCSICTHKGRRVVDLTDPGRGHLPMAGKRGKGLQWLDPAALGAELDWFKKIQEGLQQPFVLPRATVLAWMPRKMDVLYHAGPHMPGQEPYTWLEDVDEALGGDRDNVEPMVYGRTGPLPLSTRDALLQQQYAEIYVQAGKGVLSEGARFV